MAAPRSVWGIDIGQCALKALKLREVEGRLQVEAFDIVEYPLILSHPEADRDQFIRDALDELLSRNDLANSRVAIAVPGQTSFTRFVKMPPVDIKKIPDLVRFEAEQQIPFDINEVIWRWQAFPDPDSPDIEVGLFAIKRSDVYAVMDPFTEMLMDVDMVQMAPLALYNFMTYDQQTAEQGATLGIDIGTDSTELVVADGPRLWTRTIQLGGNNFTEALVKAFKLSFVKAEKLKRGAATSKYARQVFQAMRPVFADLVQEIQRSIGYYTSLHREARVRRVVGVGNGFRLPGLQKFLEQNLNAPVARIDSYNALEPSPAVSAAQFTENVLGFAVAYGLALQAQELTSIETNLLPNEIASRRRWAKKRSWFAATAALLMVATLGWAGREFHDNRILSATSAPLREAQQTKSRLDEWKGQYQQWQSKFRGAGEKAGKVLELQGYRSFWPSFLGVLSEATRRTADHQTLMVAERADTLKTVPADQQQRIIVVRLNSRYESDLDRFKDAPLEEVAAGTASTSSAGPQRTRSFIPSDYYGSGGEGSLEGLEGGMMSAPPPPPPTESAGDDQTESQTNRGFVVVVQAQSPLAKAQASTLAENLVNETKELAKEFTDEFEIVRAKLTVFSREGGPVDDSKANIRGGRPELTGGRGREGFGEGMATQRTRGRSPIAARSGEKRSADIAGARPDEFSEFQMVWVVKINGDGLPKAAPTENQ